MTKQKIVFSISNSGGMSVPEAAKLAEKLGFDGLHTTGGLIGYGGGGHDPVMVMAQAAAVTERLLLGTAVLVLPFYHPLGLAKQIATLDHMSKGRVYLGIGVGERPKIHEIYGVPLKERGARGNEYIQIMKGVWTQPVYKYQGKFFNFKDIPQEKPYQSPHPPLLVGGRMGGMEMGADGKPRYKSKTAAMKRAAKLGDGWLPYLTTPEDYKIMVQEINKYRKEYGTDGRPFTWGMHLFTVAMDSYDEALESAAKHQSFGGGRKEFSAKFDAVGTPQQVIKRFQEYMDAGVTHFTIGPLVAPQNRQHQWERIAKDVLAALR